jgi:hypothetical protein
MTNDNKPPMFGPSSVIDQATYEPRSGKSAWMNELMAEFAGKSKDLAETIIGNCTTTLPMKFKFDPTDNGHTVIFAPTRSGMSVDQSALGSTDAEVAKIKIIDSAQDKPC